MKTNTLIGRRVRYIKTHVWRSFGDEFKWQGPNGLKEGDEGEIVNVVSAPQGSDITLLVRLDVNGQLVRTSEAAVITSEVPVSDDSKMLAVLKQILKAVSKK